MTTASTRSTTSGTSGTPGAPVAPALPRSHWHGRATAEELAHWQAVAEEVAQRLAVDALERDRANQDPTDELDLLREAGLVTLLDPVEAGGGGGHWESAFLAVRVLARADASVAQVLAYHYVNAGNIAFAVEPAQQADWYRRTVQGRWVWGDAVNPVDPDLELVHDDGAYRLRGTKRFCTGASAGDVVLVAATVRGGPEDGRALLAALDHDRDGIEYLGDWEALGQRLSASGSVRFDDVVVSPADVLGPLGDEPFATLITPGIQLAFGNLYLGVAEGALARGVELVRARRGSWFLSTAEHYREDPFVLRVVGELSSRIAAVAALAEQLNRRFDDAVATGAELTAEQRGDVEVDAARLKVVATEVGVETANRVFEVTGSSSASAAVGLDLFWRNVRTHSLHDPVDYKKLEVGDRVLNGRLQPISLYT